MKIEIRSKILEVGEGRVTLELPDGTTFSFATGKTFEMRYAENLYSDVMVEIEVPLSAMQKREAARDMAFDMAGGIEG